MNNRRQADYAWKPNPKPVVSFQRTNFDITGWHPAAYHSYREFHYRLTQLGLPYWIRISLAGVHYA